ncbi:hypothetical protein [Aminobacter sp. AP02]|uniref:hypothetical protein n=1 Tax=Aminobacter sp. AP02 TaxID=2135737 RepID=UPI000D6B7FBC|nr:hypothetical protein [Aminobacter sp. AP02]PWK76041.1 hypothetical protein C8K44_10226 [Aminobacter sp. AP02]
MEQLQGIEQLALVRLFKASFVAYPIVNAVHIAAIGLLLAAVTLMDLRVIGAFAALPERAFILVLRRVAFTAFGFAILSGLLMFAVRATHYAQLPVFLVKMALIALAGANFVVFAAVYNGKRENSRRTLLRLLAGVSILLWCGVLLCGRFIGFL